MPTPGWAEQARQPAKRMNRRLRLTSSIDFKRVRRTGKSVAHPLAVLVAVPTGRPGSRFGFTAGRAVGGAVQRNLAKRRLREALRPLMPRVVSGWDAILIARPALLDADWPSVQAAIAGLLARAHLVESDDRSA